MTVGQDLLAVPFPEMVEQMGLAIANAQFSLDTTSFRLAQMMSGEDFEVEQQDAEGNLVVKRQKGAKVTFGGEQFSLLELGFTPSFYQFVDTIIEIKMSITMTRTTEESRSSFKFRGSAKGSLGFFSAKASMSASSVSASFSSKYQYSAEGSSLIRTKLVPVPVPAVLEERIRALITT